MDKRLKCPSCGTRMTQVDARGATIDWCDFCQGLWFDPTELGRMLSTQRPRHGAHHPVEDALPVRGRCAFSCPRCPHTLLQGVGWDAVTLSRCPACNGLFLDRPQLEGLQHRFADGGEPLDSGDVAGAINQAGKGLFGVAELLWTVARTIGRLKGLPF